MSDMNIVGVSSQSFVLPEGFTWNPTIVNGKKEGPVEVKDNLGTVYAKLSYKNDRLNGLCEFYEYGVLKSKNNYVNDVLEGWSCECSFGEEVKWFVYKNNEKLYELKKSTEMDDYWEAIDLRTNEMISCCQYNEEHQCINRGYLFRNNMIMMVVLFRNGVMIGKVKEFSNSMMRELDSTGNRIYQGGFLNNLKKDYPRHGKGTEIYQESRVYEGDWDNGKKNGYGVSVKNGVAFYVGYWKDDVPHGEGVLMNNGKPLYKGRWENGKILIEGNKWYDYLKGEISEQNDSSFKAGKVDFEVGDKTISIAVDQKRSIYSQLRVLRSECRIDANAELVFLYKGKEVDINKPILSQVSTDSIITVGNRCVMMIEWNGESKYVKYISSFPNRCIIEAAMKKFNIAIPLEELYLLSQDGKQKFDENQTIPFDGYGNTSCILYKKSNMILDNSDSSDNESGEICIDCDGEMNKYSYEKNKTIQDYFYQYIKDNSYEDMENDTCLSSKDKQGNCFYYDFNSTLADLKIKPKDTLYFTFKGDVIFSYIMIYHQAKDKQFQYTFDTNKKTSEYISAVLQDSGIKPNPMRLKTYVLVMEGSSIPLDSSKGLSEQGVISNSTLRLVTKSDLPKPKPAVKRVVTIIDKIRNQSKEYEYDGNKTVNDYRLLLLNDIGVEVTPMRLKTYAVVVEGTKEKLELSVPLKDLKLPEVIKFEVVTSWTEDDSEESQRVNFETAMHTGSQYGNFNEVLKEVFKGMMSKEVFLALRMNEQDSRYGIWKYQGEYGRLLVKTSHLIYKLKQFNCPAIILNEYVDVLDALNLDIRDILKNFSVYDEIKEDLFVVLNCLLIREMKRLKWNDVLRSHHQYPFQMPSSVTKEQYEAAIDALIDCDWYESYVKGIKINKEKKQRYAQLKEQLMKRYSEEDIPIVQLLSLGLIRAVDTATGLERYSFSQIAVVDSTWREFECSEIGEGVLIPTHVMQMEYYVLSQRESSNSELSFVWDDQCYLSIKEKLEIICPRKRTLPGEVVINMLNNEQLKEITKEELRKATSIDNLVDRVRQRKQVMVDNEIAQLNHQLVKTNERLEELKDRRDAYLNQLNVTRNVIIQHYTDIADKKNAQSGLSNEEQERNDITISTWAYLTAVNRLDKYYVSDHGIRNLPDVITAELNTYYSPFDFQILWVSYTMIHNNPTVTLVTPPGLESLLPNRVMNLQQSSMDRLSYQSGYAIVLPLAPFEWTVVMGSFIPNRDYCLYYYPNTLRGILANGKKSEKTTTIVTCQLLQSMIHYRHKFNLKYVIPPISVSDLFPFAKNHYSSNKGPSVAVSNFRIALYTRDSTMYRLLCYPIESASQLCPFSSVQFTNQKVHYSYSHYISANTNNHSEIRCLTPEMRIPDIDQYNQLVKTYDECIKDCNLAEVDCKKISNSIVSARSAVIADYFFPSQITTIGSISVAKPLDSILVIIRNGDEVTVNVPKNDSFALPDSIKGIDGNVIRLPYMMIGDGMILTVESENPNCNVGVQGGEIVIEIVDDELGFKLYELIAVVKDSNMKVLTRRVFNITFERKMVENLIRTSRYCSCKTTSQWSWSGYYYTLTLYPSSLPIDIWVGNEKRTYKNQSSSGYYYYPKKSQTIHGTNVILSDEYDEYGKDMEFVYDAQSIKPLTRHSVSNTITINTTVKTDSTRTLQMMESKSIQVFLSSFTNLSITILQAKERDKERLMSLLNNCCESPYLLPAIKSKAEQVKRSITPNEFILKWSSDQIDLERKSGRYNQNDAEDVKHTSMEETL